MSGDDDLAKAKALLDAFDTIEDTGHTSRSGGAAREAPMATPKAPAAREAPTVGLALTTKGVMAHEAGAESLREAPIDIGHKVVHEAPTDLGYASTDDLPAPKTDQESSTIPVPLPKKDDD